MLKYLIIWNNTSFLNLLSDNFDKEGVVSNSKDLSKVIDKLNAFDSLVVLCELGWSIDKEKVQCHQLSGIEVIKSLRRDYNVTTPVLFVSFLSLEQIINSEREILTAIGHDFLQLPVTPDDISTQISKSFYADGYIRKLSEMELMDIKSFYCSKEGILSHELHQLNSYLNITLTTKNQAKVYAELVQSIHGIHALFQVNPSTAIYSFKNKFASVDQNNINIAVNYIKNLGADLMEKYGESDNKTDSVLKIQQQYKWKVLLLDDEITDDHELIKTMLSKNMQVICVSNALDAKLILEEDWRTENRIMVIIADYRLYEYSAGIRRHQKIQGYQFLKDIASTDHLVRLVAFSGLQRKFLFNSFKYYNIRTEIKSKTDYLSSEQTRQIFCDEIIEIAEDNLEAIEEMPSKCAGFKKYLELAYRAFRMYPDYNKMENYISFTAKEYVREIKQQAEAGEEIIIGAIDNIKSPLAKTKKDEEAYFKRLSNYLVARRIALWLYAANKKGKLLNIDSRRIAEILTEQKYPSNAYRQILSTNLGLSLDDFPKNITIEERRWLQYEMQMNIFHDIQLIVPVHNQLSQIFKDFIIANEGCRIYLSNNNLTIIDLYKNNNYNLDFNADFSPDIKTATDIRFLFLWISKFFKTNFYDLSLIKPLVSRIRFALFENREQANYLKQLFHYFNSFYRILNFEKEMTENISSKIKDKSTFENNSKDAIQIVFEQVCNLLLEESLPDAEKNSADVFSVFIHGEDVLNKLGREILNDKARFFNELTKEINKMSSFIGFSINEGFGYKKNINKDVDDDSDDFKMFYGIADNPNDHDDE